MADKPFLDPFPGHSQVPSSDSNGSSAFPSDVEIRLRSTERIKFAVQRCERTNAPHHLLVRIRETLISVTARDRTPRQ